MANLAPLTGPLGCQPEPDADLLAELAAKARHRRIVLLPEGGDLFGPAKAVLSAPAAHEVNNWLRICADAHPGRVVAAEWLSEDGRWHRWLWRRG